MRFEMSFFFQNFIRNEFCNCFFDFVLDDFEKIDVFEINEIFHVVQQNFRRKKKIQQTFCSIVSKKNDRFVCFFEKRNN